MMHLLRIAMLIIEIFFMFIGTVVVFWYLIKILIWILEKLNGVIL